MKRRYDVSKDTMHNNPYRKEQVDRMIKLLEAKGLKEQIPIIKEGLETTFKDAWRELQDIRSGSSQHPNWYTHADTSNLVNLNLSTKQFQAFQALHFDGAVGAAEGYPYIVMPSVYALWVQLTTPHGDEGGWQMGVRLLYQQIRTANSGRINFTVQDLEKYIQNVRALISISAYLRRLYSTTYTFRSTNAGLPRLLLEAMDIDFNDIMLNAADLLMYTQRFEEQINKSFPLNIDYYKRAEWLFGNVFIDSTSEKPSYLVPTFAGSWSYAPAKQTVTGGIITYFHTSKTSFTYGQLWKENNSAWSKCIWWPIFSKYRTYAELIAMCEDIKNTLLDDNVMSVIAGDIVKAFGNKAFRPINKVRADQGVSLIYDAAALSQFQNAKILSFNAINMNSRDDLDDCGTCDYQELYSDPNTPGFGYEDWISPDLEVVGFVHDDFTTEGDSRAPLGFDGDIASQIIESYNTALLNWHANKIAPGEIMSITRLTPSGAALRTDGNHDVIEFSVYGTEVIAGFYCLWQQATNVVAGQINETKFLPVGGLLIPPSGPNSFLQSGNYVNAVAFAWANLDWAPRYCCISTAVRTIEEPKMQVNIVGPEVIDWDVFGLAQAQWLSNYFSYGNQSILYAGASQNQSNRRVYLKSSSKSKKYGKSSGDKENKTEEGNDKP